MNKWHYILIVIALMIILALTIWQAPPAILLELSEQVEQTDQQFPDAYLIQTKTTQYNINGDISHILTANKVSHFEAKKNTLPYSLLEQPLFTFLNHSPNKTAPWKASSHTARSINDDEEITFHGNVVFIQQTNGSDIPTTITSEKLRVKPNEQYAETDKPVMIKNTSGTTTATGLKMSLDNETIELLSNVRSRYEAQP
jgi:lipopolysaccharide export system protein LptC